MSNRISDDSDYYDTEEENEEWNVPINAAWGVPAAEEQPKEQRTNNVSDWHNIADRNPKIRADGVGGGNLHRKGKNFKPVDEQYIVNQRLGKPLPKKGKSKAKSISVSKRATKVSIQPIAHNRQPHAVSAAGLGKKSSRRGHTVSTTAAADRARAIGQASSQRQPTNPVWTAGTSLVTTPFWEQSSSRSSTHAAPARNTRERRPPPPNAAVVKAWLGPLATNPVLESPAKTQFQIKGAAENVRKAEIARSASLLEHPTPKRAPPTREITILPPAQQQTMRAQNAANYKVPVNGSNGSIYAPNPVNGSNSSIYAPKPVNGSNSSIYAPKPVNGSNSSIYASKPENSPAASQPARPAGLPAARLPVTPSHHQATPQRQTAPPAPSQGPAPIPTTSKKAAGSVDSMWANPKVAPKAPPGPKAPPILFTLNIELERGETVPITVRANDDPRQLAVAFVQRYQQQSGNTHPSDGASVVQALTQLIEQQIRAQADKK